MLLIIKITIVSLYISVLSPIGKGYPLIDNDDNGNDNNDDDDNDRKLIIRVKRQMQAIINLGADRVLNNVVQHLFNKTFKYLFKMIGQYLGPIVLSAALPAAIFGTVISRNRNPSKTDLYKLSLINRESIAGSSSELLNHIVILSILFALIFVTTFYATIKLKQWNRSQIDV